MFLLNYETYTDMNSDLNHYIEGENLTLIQGRYGGGDTPVVQYVAKMQYTHSISPVVVHSIKNVPGNEYHKKKLTEFAFRQVNSYRAEQQQE